MMQNSDELFFEVDMDDNPIGPITRKEANKVAYKFHRAVNVFVKIGDKYLVTTRRKDKDTYPGCYDLSVSGHVNYPEEYIDAAVRETEEEIGLKVEGTMFKELGKLLVKMPTENEFQMNYLLVFEDIKKDDIQTYEAESIRYMTLEELLESVSNNPLSWAKWAVDSIQKFSNKLV